MLTNSALESPVGIRKPLAFRRRITGPELSSVYERLQTRQPHGLGLQISSGVDDEISLFHPGGRRWEALSGTTAGDCAKQGDGDLRWGHQPRPRPYADWDSAAYLSFQGGPVSEGEEFPQNVVGL